jgi:hypothetical protein
VPPRSTRAIGAAIFLRAAMARSARYSWTNPSRIAKPTITPMAMASTISPRYAETAVAMSRIRMRRFWNWASNTGHGDTRCT